MSLYHKTQVQMVHFYKSDPFQGVLSDPTGPVGSARSSWVQLETELVQESTMERKIECILRNNVKTGKLPSESLNI